MKNVNLCVKIALFSTPASLKILILLISRMKDKQQWHIAAWYMLQRDRGNSVDRGSRHVVQCISIKAFRYGSLHGQTTVANSLSLCACLWCFCSLNRLLNNNSCNCYARLR